MKLRNQVTEITLDMANSMKLIAKRAFPKAIQVTDRFHVQKLALEAVQEVRIKLKWLALDQENTAIAEAKSSKTSLIIKEFSNGDSPKQLLNKGRFLLYKSQNKGSISNVGEEYKFYDIYSKKLTLGQLLRIVKINPS